MSGQDMRKLMEAIANMSIDAVDHVTVNLTGEQWQLFTLSMDTVNAAKALNRAVEDNVNQGLSREEVTLKVNKVMDEYSPYGAYDTEPRGVLAELLDEIYGVDEF